MRIAVLGAGSAGMIAAAHIRHALPEADLVQIRDPSIPSIGVGEGTNPRFSEWLAAVTGLGLGDLEANCHATLKIGTRFEGWGRQGAPFLNRFQPSHRFGFHLDATQLAVLLGRWGAAAQRTAHVITLRRHAAGVEVLLSGQESLEVDYVFDARGFPARRNEDLEGKDTSIPIAWIPTNSARLYRLTPARPSIVTRAVARAHGWIFCIPLLGWTSCGYIYNDRLSSEQEVDDDFQEFVQSESIEACEYRGGRSFPNHISSQVFDGRIFQVGNAAGFIEPLEATAISTAIVQVRKACAWIRAWLDGERPGEAEIKAYNSSVISASIRDSLFLAWHYACGSAWQTPFWQQARLCYLQSQFMARVSADWHLMQRFIDTGRHANAVMLSQELSPSQWQASVFPQMKLYQPFGTFSELNFAQVGHGIGFYDSMDEK